MHESIAKHTEAIAALCREYGVKRLEVFGSAARGYDFDPEHSDVDVVVLLDYRINGPILRRLFGVKDALAELLGLGIDITTSASSENPYFDRELQRDRQVLFHGMD